MGLSSVPADLGRRFDVAARAIVTTDATERSPPNEPVCELQFDTSPANDNDELHGAYRIRASAWKSFVFRKWDEPRASCQLTLPVELQGTVASTLCYYVPRKDVLDREYVLRVIGDFLRVEKWAPN